MIDIPADWGLAGLTLSAFLSATLLPGGSELVLLGLLALHPDEAWPAVWLATLGNTLGGLTSVWLGRRLPRKELSSRALVWLERWGSWALLLSWVPLIGDALCVAAGWLRLPWWPVVPALLVGKWLRYVVIALPFF
ncbi:MAG: DedA family protein [Laribacter sp.]|nr:DedA family protein [Laribacter sp.]MBP9527015.1 DedA family protein [Laribacter sp.]MBP9610311.1 DedA family protein [Laribacter sp.]